MRQGRQRCDFYADSDIILLVHLQVNTISLLTSLSASEIKDVDTYYSLVLYGRYLDSSDQLCMKQEPICLPGIRDIAKGNVDVYCDNYYCQAAHFD